MFSRSRLTSTSMKVTNRSANCCISSMPFSASSGRASQKAPIRSRIASPPKPSITQNRARRPASRQVPAHHVAAAAGPQGSSKYAVFSS